MRAKFGPKDVLRQAPVVSDLVNIVHAQLPRDLQTRFREIRVSTDPFQLRPVVVFRDTRGMEHRCYLEPTNVEGVTLTCLLPDEFIARLAALAP